MDRGWVWNKNLNAQSRVKSGNFCSQNSDHHSTLSLVKVRQNAHPQFFANCVRIALKCTTVALKNVTSRKARNL